MTALVTKHLPLVAGAPDGIKKLRALILELAVRGKLVPHDLSDEPVASLLARTADAKAALQPRGRVKAKKSPNDLAGGYPYAIPSCWKWCRLADLVEVLNGRAYKKEELLEEGTPVLRVGNLFTSNHWYYSDLILDEDRYCVQGDLLYAWSASFGPFIWSGERSIYHYHIWKLAPHSDADLCRRYLHDYLQAQTAAIKAAGHGVSMTHMTKEKMEHLPVPLPPLAEQYRIVAKVDELMALCDRLEADQADAAATHAQLVQALLDSLTQATDAADFRASWQRLSEHFHTLFTTEASIDALKQTVLQLAVMGLLSQQIESDSSASTLLGQIATARTAAASSIKRNVQKPIAPILPQEIPYALPNGWVWTRAEAVSEVIVDCPHSTPKFVPDGVLCLDTNSVKQGALVLSRARYVDQATYDERVARLVPQHGDIVFAREGSVGESMVIPQGMVCCLGQRVMLFRPCLVFPDYFRLALSEPGALARSLALHKGIGAKHVNVADMRNALIPLPPLPEQHRIVAKVDELMALCDQLKAQLVEARTLHSRLADALVAQAVA